MDRLQIANQDRQSSIQDRSFTIRKGETDLDERMAAAACDDSLTGLRELARLQAEKEALETPEQTAQLDALAARIRADLDARAQALRDLPAAACWRDIRDRHAQAVAIDRDRIRAEVAR